MSNYYKIVFLTRFFGYLLFFVGLSVFLFILGPLLQVEMGYRIDKILGKQRVVPNVVTSSSNQANSGFEEVVTSNENITPVSTDFGIIIEKINANAKVVTNVDPGNERAYTKALIEGVAHAKGTKLPGEKGNIYLFSHSTDAPWNIVRYNAIFYLLRKLEKGDRIILFYQGRRYDYYVFDKVIAQASDISYLTDQYDQEVLTLQTCDPPGTLFKRLIVRAKLKGV